MAQVSTALCSHTFCFICRSPQKPLRRVKKQDIVHAYVYNRIFLKHHARVCNLHVGENGLIRKEEFSRVPTKNLEQNAETIKMFDLLARRNENRFEQFRDVRYLSDECCRDLTGWSKEVFLEFSKNITSIYNTKKRSKEQLIALYRYWLKTGIDQTSLASMFYTNCSQWDISHLLDQIRNAIYSDIVPHFLGANKHRDYFLKFNTIMTHELHKLTEDDLVIVVDGTYTRIEKSLNNNFQYKTYSVQKKASLFKPFLVCCADGYIIDCYGPFSANENDASIFNYILEQDNDLKNLLVPHKTMILLDRGLFLFKQNHFC